MRILLLYRGGGAGGDASVAFALWDEWEKAGHEIRSFATGNSYVERAEERNKPATMVSDWREIPFETRKWADVVNLHLANEYVTWSKDGRPLRGMFRKDRLFATVHGPRPLRDVIRPLKARLAAVQGARSVQRIILPSLHKTRDWESTFPFIRNVARIANPVYEPPRMTKAEARAALGLPEGDKTVLGFVGLFRPEKGLLAVLKALEQLKRSDIELVVAGAGPEDEALRAYAKERSLPAHFMGYMYDPTAIYRASDIFLFPSSFDNFPIALMQAARCNVPIIASDIPIVRDEFGSCEYVRKVPVQDVGALAEAIKRLSSELPVNDPGLAQVVIRNCDPASVAERYLACFQGL
jgi:glycosyltransferase involved in cell wall biosynthesis